VFRSARNAYESASKATASNRELEAGALFKAARQLEAARDGWDAPDRDRILEDALRYNQRLWTFFQTELSAPEHPLPNEVRANLLRLIAFVDRRTFELLRSPARSGLDALIAIDREIAAGLAGTPSSASGSTPVYDAASSGAHDRSAPVTKDHPGSLLR
jgi:flagellar protein FlaF